MKTLDKEIDLWISVYTAVVAGLFSLDQLEDLESSVAREQADKAVMDIRKSF